MPRNNENQPVEVTPHFDEKKESILNDPTASAGSGVGIKGNRVTHASMRIGS